FKLSRQSELLAGFVLTTNLADGGGTVQCRPNQFPDLNMRRPVELATDEIDLNKRVLLPPKTWWQEESYAERFARAKEAAGRLGLNRIEFPASEPRPVGFVTSGLAYGYLVQALYEMGQLGRYPILKLGMSYPVDERLVRELAGQCGNIVVVEERRSFIEEQLHQLVARDRQQGMPSGQVKVWGKRFPAGLTALPETRGLHPSILIARLAPLLEQLQGPGAKVTVPAEYAALQREIETIDATAEGRMSTMPPRLPTFCPGCPHRDSASVCLEIKKQFMDPAYMARRHARGPVDLMFHGDTGCYTMLMYPPTTPLMHDYSGMGLGGGTGSGVDPFITNKEAVFMGDSTFFHSGQIAISQAIKLGQDITFIILDNSTTAMTGHQPTPGVDFDILGHPTARQDIEDVVRGMAPDESVRVVRADPQRRKQYRRLLEETFLADGVKVIVATKECGITRNRRRRRHQRAVARRLGYLPVAHHMNINQDVCRFCLACAEMTGCPGLTHVETDYGPKMDTSLSSCVNDGACQRVGACSSFERVTIRRRRPPRSRIPELGLDSIPEPQKRPVGEIWRACLTGVGGMGAGVATQVLVRAGHKEGYPVIFLDKKGLAIRNGGVVSQVVYNITNQPVTAIIPYGKADLLLGIDILEAARAMDPKGRSRVASRDRTAAVVNTDKVPTIRGIMGQEDFDVAELEQVIRANTRQEDYLARNISRLCETYLGSKIYANIMMIGFAFQRGLIPVSMHSIAWAIKDTIKADFRKNLLAFNMGRKLVVQKDLFQGRPRRTGWKETLDEKCRYTIRRYRGRRGRQRAEQLRQLAADTAHALAPLEESLKRDVVVRLYDCLRWGGIDYARRYADRLRRTFQKDSPENDYALTRAVVHNLAKATLIKDGPFIAELATHPEKHARDRRKYNVNRANGDRIHYRHYINSSAAVGPWKLRYSLCVPHWTMRLLKRMRFLRRLPAWHRSERMFLARYDARIEDFIAGRKDYQQALAELSSPRCMDCLNPRCREAGCPLESFIPQWVRLAEEDRWAEAVEVIHRTNNFPELTGSVCPAPCQDQCKQLAGGYPVQVRLIERRIVEKGFAAGWIRPQPPRRRTGKKVAVVGSGPAGLAAAQQLARAGHDVTVYEKEPLPGGLLRYGIPHFRLDKALIDRRIEQLRAEGVTFRTGVCVGRDLPADELRADCDALLLATGALRPRDLAVPGRESPGIHFALDFLRQENLATAGAAGDETPGSTGRYISVKDKVVAVLGGGDTGNDCVELAHMRGAKEIHQLEILPEPSPAGPPASTGRARPANGVRKRWSVATKRFAARGGSLAALEAVQVQWYQSTRGPVMREKPETAFTVPADLALLALGFEPQLDPHLAEQLGLKAGPDGRVVSADGATDAPGIFVAGDLAEGASFVARAIRSGRKAAEKIDLFLAGS
ncbi:MAG: glutamate synthase small subunit, partial [Planctomycetes bacterium]|nr:glutamate synthase small subunit [Planctomycetota bacterium]